MKGQRPEFLGDSRRNKNPFFFLEEGEVTGYKDACLFRGLAPLLTGTLYWDKAFLEWHCATHHKGDYNPGDMAS